MPFMKNYGDMIILSLCDLSCFKCAEIVDVIIRFAIKQSSRDGVFS